MGSMVSIRRALHKLPSIAKAGLVAGVAVVVALAYLLVVYQPIVADLEQARATRDSLSVALEKAKNAERDFQRELAELAIREKRAAEFNRALPQDAAQPAFISSLESAARLAGVRLTALTPRKAVTEAYFVRVPMQVELSGRFHQIARFFHNVGQLDRIINMEDISLSQPKQTGEEVQLEAKVLATAFQALAPVEEAKAGRRRSRTKRKL